MKSRPNNIADTNKKTSGIGEEKKISIVTDFITEADNVIKWKRYLGEAKQYIDTNKELPSSVSRIKNIKMLGRWIQTQNTNAQDCKYIMKIAAIRDT